MHIAIVSYEFPDETGGGGIGSYNLQLCQLLKKQHEVEVFAGSKNKSQTYVKLGVKVHRIFVINEKDFQTNVLRVFSQRHEENNFDVIEAPDYGADALAIKKKHINIPLIIRFHGPKFIFQEFDDFYLNYTVKKNFLKKAYWKLNSFFYGKTKNHEESEEYEQAMLANYLVSPSKALAKLISKRWALKYNSIVVLPNPYQLQNYNIESYNQDQKKDIRLLFIGKLTTLKGIYDFIEGIKLTQAFCPNLFVEIVGNYSFSNYSGIKMDEYVFSELKNLKNRVHFTGLIPLHQVHEHIEKSDICIVPSLFENFPTVILEAMSFEKAIIATNVGGIPEIIEHKKNGILIPPRSPKKLAKAIMQLVKDPEFRLELGKNAKRHFLKKFTIEALRSDYIVFYEKIQHDLIKQHPEK